MNYAVSACLMGVNCKYNGGNNANAKIIAFLKDRPHLTVCPEIAGGLPVPRACCEKMCIRDRSYLYQIVM